MAHEDIQKGSNFTFTITADQLQSTDPDFSVESEKNLERYGKEKKAIDVYFETANKESPIRRIPEHREHQIASSTLPMLAFQIFEKKICSLSDEEKKQFPIYKNDSNVSMNGIYSSIKEFNQHCKRSDQYSICYKYNGGNKAFHIYHHNVFSTILFVQECLKLFGQPGDRFILTYSKKESYEPDDTVDDKYTDATTYQNPYSEILLLSKNLIFRGAPGTGKSFIAKQIATDLISNGKEQNYENLSDEQKMQIEFVQFHPSYDYSDFVEGLRPKVNSNGDIGFELQDGIFKKFVARARKNYEDSIKKSEDVDREISAQAAMEDFFSNLEFGKSSFKTIRGSSFVINDVDDKHIFITIPENTTVNELSLNIEELRMMLESEISFDKVKDVTDFFEKKFATQAFSYDFAIYKAIKAQKVNVPKDRIKKTELKKYVFIIDEINRGEISKIFGELFFAIDPEYRGEAGSVSTQYANLHSAPHEKFYIPNNIYIIGTMNDIDRSVDSFDFAMRRRFRFIELKADEHTQMLNVLGDDKKKEAIRRMKALNKEIAKTEDLNENYQIGASYFLKLNNLDFDQLWTDYLKPLLEEYTHGMYEEQEIMHRFEKAYYSKIYDEGGMNGASQDQR